MLALDLETLDQIFTFRVMLPPRTAFHNILTGPFFSYLPRWDSCYPATFSSQGDRMAMAHSVEGRYPFLDHRVVRFAPALPPRLKMKVLNAKYLLKRSAAGLVPERIRTRPKPPFRASDGASFFGANRESAEEMLSTSRIRRDGIFDAARVGALVRKFGRQLPTGTGDNTSLVGVRSTQVLMGRFTVCHAPGCVHCEEPAS